MLLEGKHIGQVFPQPQPNPIGKRDLRGLAAGGRTETSNAGSGVKCGGKEKMNKENGKNGDPSPPEISVVSALRGWLPQPRGNAKHISRKKSTGLR